MRTTLTSVAGLFLLVAAACTPGGESGLEGTILFADSPLSGVAVEVYLKEEKDRSTAPFSVTVTDEQGRYRVALPEGRYFLIAKKKFEDGERTRMLMAESPANPVQVDRGVRTVAPFTLREMGLAGELVPDPETFVEGRLHSEHGTVEGAWVYLYTEPVLGLVGPSYAAAVRVDDDGSFTLAVPAGEFYLTARKRADGSRKPTVISAPTSADGRFELFLPQGGTWFIGARSAFGGPLEPGEQVGTWDGRADHGVTLDSGEKLDLGDLIVREVW